MTKLILKWIGKIFVIIYFLFLILAWGTFNKATSDRSLPPREAAFKSLKIGIIGGILVIILVAPGVWVWRKTKIEPKPVNKPQPEPTKIVSIELIEKVKANDIEGCKQLLDENCNINEQDEKGGTALIYAILNTNENMVSLLVDKGTDKTVATKKGLTAIAIAKNNKLTSILKILS